MGGYVHQLVNEPSVGLFFVQEHIRETVPVLVTQQAACLELARSIQASMLDVHDDLNLARTMSSMTHIQSVLSSLKRIEQQQQRKHVRSPSTPQSPGGDGIGW